jgi:hypothetical protein
MPLGFAFGWVFEGSGAGGYVPPTRRVVETMLWINDTPLQRFGLVLQRPTAWLDGAARALPETARIAGLTGGRYELLPIVPSRDVTLTGVMLNLPLETQQAALSALTDALSGLLELRWPHASMQVMRGVAGPLQVEPVNPDKAFVHPDRTALRVTVVIRCVDTATYARQPKRIRLSTTPKAVVVGGLPIGGEIMLEGPLSGSVDIELLSASGVLLERMALRGVSLAEGDVLTIRLDSPRLLIKRTAAGVQTNVFHWRSLSLSTGWLNASPYHADPARGQYPLVRLSTGAGWWTYAVGHAH